MRSGCKRRMIKDQTGQSIIIIAVAFVGLLVIIGLAIDLGLVYIERVKLGRAVDAAALAAAQDLPFEEFAARRAITYLKENGYDPTNTELQVMGPSNAGELSWPAPVGSRGIIVIDMETYEDPDMKTQGEKDNSADKIKVYGRINVDMNFMKLIGFTTAPVDAQAIAENVNSLDIVIVYDESGSMDDDTYCYRDNGGNKEQGNPCYIQGDSKYPAGERLYLPYATWIATPLDPPLTYRNNEILAAEAEYYSYTTTGYEHLYQRDFYLEGRTFWIIQRTEDSQASGYRYEQDDYRGAHLMHMPHQTETDGHKTVTDLAPRLDYNFDIPASAPLPSTWYAWIRAQCGGWTETSTRADSCVVHWGVDRVWRSGESTEYNDFGHRQDLDYNKNETGSDLNRWVWVRLGSFTQTDGDVQINIWGGGSGFRLDKVVITRDSSPPDGSYTDRAPAFIRATTPLWRDVRYEDYQTYVQSGRYGGPRDTGGRDGLALNECNPIYGLRVNPGCSDGQVPTEGCRDLDGNGKVDYYEICDNVTDDMYDDEQPIRAAKEAAANFIKRCKARYDQVGFVGYATAVDVDRMRELNCFNTPARAPERMPDYPGIWDPDTNEPDPAWIWCYDHRTGGDGYLSDTQSPDVTHGSLLLAIEDMEAGGNTNIAEGMQMAMLVLSSGTGHYGRANAIKFMVLLTDGVANRWPNYTSDRDCGRKDSCCAEDLYTANNGSDDENKAADCVMYYAQLARNRNTVIYTIGLGNFSDRDLLQAVADETGGRFYFAPTGAELDSVFQEIADQIFLRLVE